MNLMPKVSVIIPVYGVEKYLPTCLDSVLAQTFHDWEAICVNDGSPDKCGDILDEYAQRDKRIKVITQENQGLSMARNNGLEQATGKYVLFIDSDDFIYPQLLETCYQLAEKENADMVSFSFTKHAEKNLNSSPRYGLNNLKYMVTNEPLYFQKKRHKHKISVNVWSKLYRKDLIQDLRFIPGIIMEDYPYTYAVLAKRPKTVILDIPLYYYTNNPNSVSFHQFCIESVRSYQAGLNFVIDVYKGALPKEKNFVLHKLIPNMLKQQFNRIKKSSKEKQTELYQAFAEELKDFYEKGWLKPWGHRISRYLKYKRLMKGIQK